VTAGLPLEQEMSLGCSSISFRELPIERALERIRCLGFRTVDIGAMPGFCEHYLPGVAQHADRERLVAAVQRLALDVATINADLAPPDGRQPAVEALRDLLDLAARLGAAGVCVACGRPAGREELPAAMRALAAEVRTMAAMAEGVGLRLFVEAPHYYRLCNSLPLALQLFELVDHDNAWFTLDTSHVRAAGDDVVGAVATCGERLGHVHLRDARDGEIALPPGAGEVDFGGFFRALKAVHYSGALVVELEVGETTSERKADLLRISREHLNGLWVGSTAVAPDPSEGAP